jgi:DNA-binding response OmpR family regulator
MRLLIAEHNGQLQTVSAQALRGVGYRVDVAKTTEELRSVIASIKYELIILDASLADHEGTRDQMVRSLRRQGLRTPILVISANCAVDECVQTLDSGADDFLVKPFNNRELLARVRALLRRPANAARNVLRIRNIEVDEAVCEVRCLGRPMDLRLRERQLLAILLRCCGRVVSKEMLARTLAAHSRSVSVNAVEALVSRVRKRLRVVESGIVILTICGIGYRLSDAIAQQPSANHRPNRGRIAKPSLRQLASP